jgi:fructuronate reductase
MKLRMLNGTHSALAYLGYLAGHETIADTVADPVFAGFVRRLWAREIIPAVAAPPAVDLGAYAEALMARYRNPAIRHRTWQIAMDGSQKLPQRILGTMAEGLEAGRGVPGLALVVAGWMRYLGGVDERGQPIDVRDPMAALLRTLAEGADPVAGLLSVREVFPEAISARLAGPVGAAYGRIAALGARGAVAELGSGT